MEINSKELTVQVLNRAGIAEEYHRVLQECDRDDKERLYDLCVKFWRQYPDNVTVNARNVDEQVAKMLEIE